MVRRSLAFCLIVFIATSAMAAGKRRAVRPKAPPKSSEGLILDALQRGAIGSETALLYRVYNAFSDDRLPAAYRGDDSNVFDSLVMVDARQRFATLSPQAQSALIPYLIPPFFTNSWWGLRHRAGKEAAPTSFGIDCGVVDTANWEFVDAKSANVRVWSLKSHNEILRASRLATEIDTKIYPKLVSLLGMQLLGDDGTGDCRGGSGRVDVALTDIKLTVTEPFKSIADIAFGPPLPAYVQMARNAEDGDFAVAAHELMHAYQFGYKAFMDHWMMESFAQWTQDYVYRDPAGDPGHEQRAAIGYLDSPQVSILLDDMKHDYGAYVFPFFVDRTAKYGLGPAFIKKSYEAIAPGPVLPGPSITAIASVLRSAGGLDQVWKDFAVAAYNQAPFDDFTQWDNLKTSVKGGGGWTEVPGELGGIPEATVALDEVKTVQKMSIHYYDFTFTNDSTHSVTFWNGFSRKLSKGTFTAGPLSGATWVSDARDDAAKKGLGVQALIKVNGKWTREDWTDRPYVSLCRDKTAEHVEELVVIMSNSDYERSSMDYTLEGTPSQVILSNVGCYQYRGLMTVKASDKTTIEATADVVWKRGPIQGVPEAPYLLSFYGEGQVQWKISGGADCPTSGMGNGPLGPAGQSNFLLVVDGLPSGDNNRSYVGIGSALNVGKYHDCNGDFQADPVWFAAPPPMPPAIPIFHVKPDGSIDGMFTDPNGLVATWHLTAERQ